MKFAYADPPYPGMARKHYGDHPDYGGEVDHTELVGRLVSEYPDGWALSTAAKSLQSLLALCPPGVRTLAWFKPAASPPMSVRVQFYWEPVILCGGRPWTKGISLSVKDVLVATPEYYSFRPKPDGYVTGAKPPTFCRWIFACLGAEPDDTLDDLFPGSGVVAREWAAWSAQSSLFDRDLARLAPDEADQ